MPAEFIFPHLGLGDAIVLNGMVRYLAPCLRQLIWPCKWTNVRSVSYMFNDLANVYVQAVSDDEEARQLADWYSRMAFVLRLGLHGKEPLNFSAWDKQMYGQAGVSFSERWEKFNLPVGVRTPDSKERKDKVFIHDDIKRGFIINLEKVPKLPMVIPRHIENGTIFDWLADLQTASEIHVIDSAFLCLADSVPTLAERLVFHRYSRPNGHPPTLRKNWEMLQ